jgi:phage tail-like protein
MTLGDRIDPYKGFKFKVEVGGVVVAGFGEVSGLTAEGDAVAYTVRRPTGLRKYTNIVLKRGYTTSKELMTWYRNNASGIQDRRSGTIIQVDEKHNEVRRWSFQSAWPAKIEGPALSATANEVAIESIELTHEGLVLET